LLLSLARTFLALFFVVSGINHFLSPTFYLAILPSYLPWHAQLVAVSGAAEILGGLGVLFPATRKLAAWGLIALLVAVFPANIEAISSGMVIAGHAVPNWMQWARLPLQLVFLIWVYLTCLKRTSLTSLGDYIRSFIGWQRQELVIFVSDFAQSFLKFTLSAAASAGFFFCARKLFVRPKSDHPFAGNRFRSSR
jgi:uncharacterized membrane protein